MKKFILILGLSILILGSSTNINGMGCSANAQCSPTVVRSCTGASECEVLVCIHMICDGVVTSLEDCPNCQIVE